MVKRRLKTDVESNEVAEETPVSNGASHPAHKLITEIPVKTRQGGMGTVPLDGFDFSTLNNFTPFTSSEELPQAQIKVNRRGLNVLVKNGAPRFYIKGDKVIKVYMGLSGKKSEMVKKLKPAHKPLDRKIKNHLLKIGLPQL